MTRWAWVATLRFFIMTPMIFMVYGLHACFHHLLPTLSFSFSQFRSYWSSFHAHCQVYKNRQVCSAYWFLLPLYKSVGLSSFHMKVNRRCFDRSRSAEVHVDAKPWCTHGRKAFNKSGQVHLILINLLNTIRHNVYNRCSYRWPERNCVGGIALYTSKTLSPVND